MPIQQIDNTRVTSYPKPTGSYTHYDPKAPKPGVIQDTGTITEDNSNPVRKAIQNYTASYLNSNFANSPFMDVMRWLPGLSYIERVVTGQPVEENESLSMVMPIKTPIVSAKLPMAERLGLTKAERNSMSRNQREALEDLEYLLETDKKNKFVIRDGKPIYVSDSNPGDVAVIRDMINNGATYNEHGGFSLKTPEGYVRILPSNTGRNKFGYVADNFPTQWGDATVMPAGYRYQKIILTSPYTDMFDSGSVRDLAKSTEIGVSKVIPKDVMKGLWKNVDKYTQPGTYLSGDEGSMPMGWSLYQRWKNRNSIVRKSNNDGSLGAPERGGNLNTFYTMLTSPEKIKSRTNGLSTDSYLAILKQGNRPGHKLRFSNDGFTTFNSQGVENKFISDMLEQAKAGKISQQTFVDAFNNWVKPYNGAPAMIKNGEVVIPHPFVLYEKGGKI